LEDLDQGLSREFRVWGCITSVERLGFIARICALKRVGIHENREVVMRLSEIFGQRRLENPGFVIGKVVDAVSLVLMIPKHEIAGHTLGFAKLEVRLILYANPPERIVALIQWEVMLVFF